LDWPENSSPGDEVHVLLGSPAPYILGQVNESFRADGQTEAVPAYTIIGHAYLHEIMFGEAFKNDGGKSMSQSRFTKFLVAMLESCYPYR